MIPILEKVIEMGELALKLDNIYSKGISLENIESHNKEVIEMVKEHVSEYKEKKDREDEISQVGIVHSITKIGQELRSELRQNEKNRYPVAARLYEHHFLNEIDALDMRLDIFSSPKGKVVTGIGDLQRYISIFQMVRSYITGMAYLANGDKKYLIRMPHNDLGLLLKLTNNDIVTKAAENMPDSNNLVYLSLLQFVLNADSYRSKTAFRAEISGDFVRYDIIDDSHGILNKEKKPMESSELYKLFFGFSTKGGGLGLQTVNYVAELLGGYVEVATKTKGNAAIAYNTKKGVIDAPEHFPPLLDHGTMFSLYVPISSL